MKIKIACVAILLLNIVIAQSQEVLSPETLWKLKRLSGAQLSPDQTSILYQMTSYSLTENKGNTDLYLYDLAQGESKQLTHTPFSEMEAQWGADHKIWFLSTQEGGLQIWSMAADGTDKKRISDVKNHDIEGFKLSPDGKKVILLAPVKTTQTVVDKYPDLPLAQARVEDDLLYRHWSAWSDEFKRHLFLYDVEAGKLSQNYSDLLEGEGYDGILPPFGGLETVSFSPNMQKITYCSKKKTGKDFALSTNSELYEYDIASKKTNLLTKGYQGYDTAPKYSSDVKYLAWLSMAKDGFEADKNDLILRDLSTGKDVNLSKKHDITIQDYIFSEDLKSFYLLVPYQGTTQIFELDLATQELKQLTEGVFNYLSMEQKGGQLIAMRQSMIEPTDIFSVQLSNGKARQLTAVNKDELANIALPKVESRWIETSDHKKMLVWLVLPPDFDSQKKYPSLLYCQGGPQSMVSQFFSYRWNLALMASQGYIVIAPNRRGLPGFGQEWNDAISKDWGGQAMRDYLTAVDVMSKEPFVDQERLGAVGASYGGYSVYYLAGIHEKRFKTFISHCGLFNLESWYGTTEELFFANWDNKGPYWLPENKSYYEKNSPHRFVQNWDTPMLVIHGGKDFRVPESEGMQAYQALQLKNLRSKYLYFPNEGHWVTKPQNGVLWQREFFEWLATDLKP